MSLNEQTSAERLHIGFFGLRNAGKSSLVNAFTGQQLSLVSDIKGTTTDPVQKAMELLPIGPIVVIDTPGIDDYGALGEMRVQRARAILDKTDLAILTADALIGLQQADKELIALFKAKEIPYIIAYNKADLLKKIPECAPNEIYVSAKENININALKELAGKLSGASKSNKRIISDLLKPGDTAVLVTPIDASAPKGRLILPQQQTIRDILDGNAIALVCQETELSQTLQALKSRPSIVITDSQVFEKVDKAVPSDIPLTSFSILFARYKGNLLEAAKGAVQLDKLRDGDRILIAEGCTHHRQCEDIGTVKLPRWIENYTRRKLKYEFTSGGDFPENLSGYALVIHCGGCRLNEREMKARIRHSADCGVPITNYGVAIAQMHSILKRALTPFSEIVSALD